MFLILGFEAISKELLQLDHSKFIIVQLTILKALYGNRIA
jgi:hypothetical protein